MTDIQTKRVKLVDWAGNEPYPGHTFASVDDAWSFLTEDQRKRHPQATEAEFDDIMGEFEIANVEEST